MSPINKLLDKFMFDEYLKLRHYNRPRIHNNIKQHFIYHPNQLIHIDKQLCIRWRYVKSVLELE